MEKLFPADVQIVERIHGREGYKKGPWDKEPDRIQWRDSKTGMVCLIRRNSFGNLCGYVGVEPGHPWHNKGYMEVDAEVHGGLTYASECDDDPIQGICHVPQECEPDHLYWLGFDCAHWGDGSPGRMDMGGTYRTVEYVHDEVHNLARQAKEAV